jgi:hypothetical protein
VRRSIAATRSSSTPHIRRQHIYEAATATIKVIDVNTLPNLTIGC